MPKFRKRPSPGSPHAAPVPTRRHSARVTERATSEQQPSSSSATTMAPPSANMAGSPDERGRVASLEWLLTVQTLLDVDDVARTLKMSNVERVHKLPIMRVELSDRTTRFCPESLYRFVVGRSVAPGQGAGGDGPSHPVLQSPTALPGVDRPEEP